MSKRSRKERRLGQLERAVGAADPAALQALVDKSPEGAASHLRRAMEALPADPAKAARIEAIALRLAKQLRREGKPAVALDLAASGRHRSTGFRLEEALAAFALGRDEIAASIAAMDPAVLAVLDPLLKAARAEVEALPPQGRKAVSTPPIAPPLRALHTVARAIGLSLQGQGAKSRAALKLVDKACAARVYAHEIGLALELSDPRRVKLGLRRALGVALFRSEGPVRRAMIAELADTAPELLPTQGNPLLRGTTAFAQRRLREQLLAATTPGMAMAAIRDAEIELFAEPDQANAALYKGFGLIAQQPLEAGRCFDRAIQLGGDLVEALRGKVLLSQSAPDLEGVAPDRGPREAAVAAERLARALARDPQAKPLAAAAEKLAIEAFTAARDMRSALSAIARARPLASGSLLAELELDEIQAIGYKDRNEALRRLDLLLAKDPGNVEAWEGKIALTAHSGDTEGMGKALLEAAAATRDPGLMARARSLRIDRGQLAPFDDLVPGALSPGAVAAELRLVFAQGNRSELLPRVEPFRAALSPQGRLALDVVSMVLATSLGEDEAALHLGEIFQRWKGSPKEAAWVASAALLVDLDPAIFKATRGIEDDAVLRAIAHALLVADERTLAGKFLPRIAAGMSRKELAAFKAFTRTNKDARLSIPGVLTPTEVAGEISKILAPELSFTELLEEDDGDFDEDEGGHDLFDEELAGPAAFGDTSGLPADMKRSLLATILRAVGVSPGVLDKLPRDKRLAFERAILQIIVKPPSAATESALHALFASIGVSIDLGRGIAPAFRPGRSRKRAKHELDIPF